MRLQVVEDDAVLRDGLQVGLTACGWTVEAVCGAEDALAAIAPPLTPSYWIWACLTATDWR